MQRTLVFSILALLFLAPGGLAHGAADAAALSGRGSTNPPLAVSASAEDAPGTSWTVRSATLRSVAYGGGRFVAVGDDGIILTSPDGVEWTARNSGTNAWLNSVTYGNGRFVAVGWFGKILTSSEGITWMVQDLNTISDLNSVTYSNGRFVAVGEYGIILTSP